MKTEAARCAKEIKDVLKKVYPSIEFSVKSQNFSMGNSVNVSWNLGPTTQTIDKIIGQYQYGHFDGMTDYYDISNSRDDIPQAKYVQTSRSYQTAEEIANSKLKWSDSNHRDLWDEEKTLNHVIGRDLCAMMGTTFKGLNNYIDARYAHMVSGYHSPSLGDLVNALMRKVSLMTGYNGIKLEKAEDGRDIINSFIVC